MAGVAPTRVVVEAVITAAAGVRVCMGGWVNHANNVQGWTLGAVLHRYFSQTDCVRSSLQDRVLVMAMVMARSGHPVAPANCRQRLLMICPPPCVDFPLKAVAVALMMVVVDQAVVVVVVAALLAVGVERQKVVVAVLLVVGVCPKRDCPANCRRRLLMICPRPCAAFPSKAVAVALMVAVVAQAVVVVVVAALLAVGVERQKVVVAVLLVVGVCPKRDCPANCRRRLLMICAPPCAALPLKAVAVALIPAAAMVAVAQAVLEVVGGRTCMAAAGV